MASQRELTFEATPRAGAVSALLRRPEHAKALYLLAHGAGAGMRHRFLEAMVDLLEERSVATLRYQFPYMEAGRKRPDHKTTLLSTIRAAVAFANEVAQDLPLVAGGKSMGGRMTSLAASEGELPRVRGLVFLGFPLHAAGKPDDARAAHLGQVSLPMLFLQGTRDSLAELGRIEAVCEGLGRAATLHIVDDGDHSFRVRKRSGQTEESVQAALADTIAGWVSRLLG